MDGPFPTMYATDTEGYVVLNANSQYISALAVIGRSADYLQLSSEQLAKLSNASTGGKFYEFASSFVALGNDGGTNHYVSWWGDAVYQAEMVNISGGYGHVWAVQTNQSKIASALEDYMVIYNGGSLGGGSGGGVNGYVPPSSTFELLIKSGWIKTATEADQKHFYVNASNISGLRGTYLSDYSYGVYVMYGGSVSYSTVYCTLILSDSPITYTRVFRPDGQQVNTYGNFRLVFNSQCTKWCVCSGGSFSWTEQNSVGTFTFNQTLDTSRYTGAMNHELWVSGYAISEPSADSSVPDSNWPDAPATEPTLQPTVPDPSDIDIDVTFPNISVTVDNDFTADLQGILDALDEHCQHLQRAIYNGFAGFFESLKEFEESLYTQLVTYYHDVTEWLQDWFELLQSDIDKIDIDISAINRYLYRILREMGGGGGATDVTGIESQLDTIISRLDALLVVEGVDAALDLAHFLLDLLGELLDTISSVVSGVTDAFGDLTEVFPFSIPWDIAAIAALFAAEPVTPAFDIPFPAIAGGEGTLIHVDLSDFDGV